MAAATGLMCIFVTSAPASATYYSGGMPYAYNEIKPYSYNSQWQGPMDQALYNWYLTPTPAYFPKSSSASNYITAAYYSDTWYGQYTRHDPWFGSKWFDIKLNSRTISSDASNFGNFVTSTLVHELGHALSLADNPPVCSSCSIMRYDRNRNTMTTPQTYDINDVNSFY